MTRPLLSPRRCAIPRSSVTCLRPRASGPRALSLTDRRRCYAGILVEMSGKVEVIIDNVPHANEPPGRRRSSSISLDHGSLPIRGVGPPISLKRMPPKVKIIGPAITAPLLATACTRAPAAELLLKRTRQLSAHDYEASAALPGTRPLPSPRSRDAAKQEQDPSHQAV